MAKWRHLSIVIAPLLITACVSAGFAQQSADLIAPEFATGRQSADLVRRSNHMVVAANPYASEAGDAILQAGGNAVDAMVTVQLVLGLVEPQSSGLGGGAFLLYWDAASGQLTSYDGRETAPKAADENLFLDSGGKPLKFFDAVIGGRSVGVPGTPRLLYDVHKKHGALPWAEVPTAATDDSATGARVKRWRPRL